jgi:hypothetical protein
LNTQAPLTLPGTRSTAAHSVQSNIFKSIRQGRQADKGRQPVASISQGGLDFWLEPATDFLPGDTPAF